MNRDDARRVADEVKLVAGAALSTLGYEIAGHRARYGEGHVTLTLEVVESAPAGSTFNPNTAEAHAFTAYAAMEGIDPAALGKTIDHHGKTSTIIGFRARAPKYPILVEDQDGERHALQASFVARRYPKEAPQ